MKYVALCALLFLLPFAAAAAIQPSAYRPLAGDAAREQAPEKRKRLPAPAPTEHFASRDSLPPAWTI